MKHSKGELGGKNKKLILMLKYFNFHTQELEATSLCCFPSKKWLTSLEYTQLVDYQIDFVNQK